MTELQAAQQRQDVTFRYERWRALSSGIIEAAASSLLLLIAVRNYGAGATPKALLAAASSMGLLMSPAMVWLVARGRWPVAQAASRVAALGAVAFAVAACLPWESVFVAGCALGVASSSACVPLFTQIYQENYPAHDRGRLFSSTFMLRIAAAALFSGLAGGFLSRYLEWFQVLIVFFAGAMAFSSFCLSRCPSRPLLEDAGGHPLRGLRYIREDALFARTLASWMLMGFANLMMLPLRVEYLANPAYGLQLDPATVAILTGVIPNCARFVMSPIWGKLFDRMNFFTLRITLNVGFALGIFGFFNSGNGWGLIVAAVLYGVSNAGGDVAWSLWVTRFAPPDRVAEYMAMHTFTTGIRGVIAPAAAFYLIQKVPVSGLALGCALMIGMACLLLIPEMRAARVQAPGKTPRLGEAGSSSEEP